MANFWKTNECYKQSGVDGSQCSFQQYLSEVGSQITVSPELSFLVLRAVYVLVGCSATTVECTGVECVYMCHRLLYFHLPMVR